MDSARQVTDIKDANLRIWRLRPSDVSDFQLLGIERKGEDALQERYGTFARLIARERPDLEFYSVGHPVVDALADASRRYVKGRTFAVQAKSIGIEPGYYLCIRWRVIPGAAGIEDVSVERVDRYLTGRFVPDVIDIGTEESVAEQQRNAVDALLHPPGLGAADFRGEQLLNALSPFLESWGTKIARLVGASETHALAIYADRYGALDRAFSAELAADASLVARTRDDETPAYSRSLDACVAALKDVRVTLDSVGIVKVTEHR
jgi:hypothetical protein